MLKVKTFVLNSGNAISHHSRLDDSINKFIADNEIEVKDIKFSSAICGEPDHQYYSLAALLMYSEK